LLSTGFLLLLTLMTGGTDRADEAERNLARRAWFNQQRGLDHQADAGLRRARSARLVRQARGSRVAEASWVSLGPDTATMFSWRMGRVAGRVSAIVVNPGNRDRIFIGTGSGGLWKTTDGGGSWTPIFDEVGTLSIGAMMMDPNDSDTIYVGTGDHTQGCTGYFGMGLFRTVDGGDSFQPLNGSAGQLLELSHIAAIAKSPDGVLFAGGHAYCDEGTTRAGALFRSDDDGATWSRVLDGAIGDIVAHPADPDLLWAAVGRFGAPENGIYRSTDGGINWSRLTNNIESGLTIGRTRLVAAPSDPDTLYALLNGVDGITALYRSTDGGDSWLQRQAAICTEQCWYNLSIAVHPTDPTKLMVGAIIFSASDDGGFSFAPLIEPWGDTQQVHQDIHAIVYDPGDPNRFWIGCDGGIWRSDNGGVFYHNLNANLSITQLFDVAVRPGSGSDVFAGAMDNSSMRTNGNIVWNVTFANGDGTNNAVDPREPNIVYQAGTPDPVTGPRVIRSDTGGNPGSFTLLTNNGIPNGESWSFKPPLTVAADPNGTTSHVFMGSQRVFRSSDRGQTWLPLSNGSLGGGNLNVLTPFVDNGKLGMLAGTVNGRIFRCADVTVAEPTWLNVTDNYPNGAVTGIAVDPTDPSRVLISRGGFGFARLYRSTIGGGSWSAVGTGLPDIPANDVVLDPLDPSRVLIATDLGVYQSHDGGDTVTPFDNGLPFGLVITDLEVDHDPHMLTAATYGRGVWQITLAQLSIEVDAGPDRTICSGESIVLEATPANAQAPLDWAWSITGGPDLDSGQFDDPTSPTPTFSPTGPGTYTLEVVLTDMETDSAFDVLVVNVGDRAAFDNGQRAAWRSSSDAAGTPDQADRDDNGLVDLIDLVVQVDDPICPF